MKQQKLTTLENWARARYGEDAPSIYTLRRWCKEGRLWPPAVKRGRAYLVERRANYRPYPAAPFNGKHTAGFYTNQRRAALLRRIPAWADMAAIAAIYAECERKNREGPERHHVDHDIPLQGQLVSGLHVAENLVIITATANAKKHNRWPLA